MPHQAVDLWALSDLATPWCLRVVATLRIAEHIEAGHTQIVDLAATAEADADALQRVLRHLIHNHQLFEELTPGTFTLNDAARGLLDEPLHLSLDLDAFGGRMAYPWRTLLTAVRTGAPAYQQVFGAPFWDDLQAHPKIHAQFDALMGPAGHGTPDPNFEITGGWSSVRTVVDVGGGTGTLLAEILRAQPGVRGILVDLPATIERSRETFRAAGVADRVTSWAQSFFDPLPASGDLYLLKSVMSDWPDRDAQVILTRCAEAARAATPNAGRVMILNGVSPDEDGPAPADLLMLVLVGGRYRTLKEFHALARAAGLDVIATARQGSHRFTVECRPR